MNDSDISRPMLLRAVTYAIARPWGRQAWKVALLGDSLCAPAQCRNHPDVAAVGAGG
jgi:hypothetical protein